MPPTGRPSHRRILSDLNAAGFLDGIGAPSPRWHASSYRSGLAVAIPYWGIDVCGQEQHETGI